MDEAYTNHIPAENNGAIDGLVAFVWNQFEINEIDKFRIDIIIQDIEIDGKGTL